MNPDFLKVEIDGWIWHVRNPELLREWFPIHQTLLGSGIIKSNAKRTVFKISPQGKTFYVKFNKNASPTGKLLSSFLPKAASEARSSLLLESCGIRTPKVEGWGSKGFLSMIVLEEIKDAISAKKFWFETASQDINLKSKFLEKLSDLLSQILLLRISHPDLHPGNILVVPDKMELWLIDLFRARQSLTLRNSQVFGTLRLFGFMRGDLTEKEACDVLDSTIKKANLANFADIPTLWQKIIEAEEKETQKAWPKRESAIKLDDDRYVLKHNDWLIRRSITGKPLILPDEFEYPPIPPLTVMSFPIEKAKELWLASFYNDFMRRKIAVNAIAMKVNETEGVLIVQP